MSSSIRIIGFTGRKRSGKDTAAKALCDIGWQSIGFADPLKAGALAINPTVCVDRKGYAPVTLLADFVKNFGWEEAKKEPDIRRFLQRYGTEGGRDVFGQDCWVDLARQKIIRQWLTCPGFVLPDVRFANEVEMIQKQGGIVVLIQRPSLEGQFDDHRSEQLAFQTDATILNNGTPEELQDIVRHLIR